MDPKDSKFLLKLSIILFTIGIIILFFIVLFIKPTPLDIDSIGSDQIGNIVRVNGTITTKHIVSGNLFLSVSNGNNSIKAVMFQNDIKSLDLSSIREGDFVSLVGKVEKYKTELEIIIENIMVIT